MTRYSGYSGFCAMLDGIRLLTTEAFADDLNGLFVDGLRWPTDAPPE